MLKTIFKTAENIYYDYYQCWKLFLKQLKIFMIIINVENCFENSLNIIIIINVENSFENSWNNNIIIIIINVENRFENSWTYLLLLLSM